MTSESLVVKYALAKKLLREIASEWINTEDIDTFQDQHVASYGSSMSFDELLGEIEAIQFK
jgi:hypothetical protein